MQQYSREFHTTNGQTVEDNTTEFLEEMGKLTTYAKAYVDDKIEYTKVVIAEESVKTISGIVHGIVLASLSSVLIIFLSVVAGLALGRALEDYVLGFLLVCAFYLIILVLYLVFRQKIVNDPLTKAIIQKILR
ncbi:MAG: phage holin family protein [Bacteroidota bacterium]